MIAIKILSKPETKQLRLLETLRKDEQESFNKCLTEGVTPKSWKTATVSPIFKNGNKQDPANYRPVSVTSVVSKIMERLISQHIQQHIISNNLMSNVQHGFMSNKSTTTNLLEATNFWTEHLQHYIPIDMVYLDFSKAFDRVAHQRLLKTLSSYQIQLLQSCGYNPS